MKRSVFIGTTLCAVLAALHNPAPGQAAPDFSGEEAFRYLEKQCSFGPRNPGSSGHAACLSFLVGELKKFSPQVSAQPFLFHDPGENRSFTLTNIIARFPGSSGGTARVLLAAHWDTRPRADRETDPARRIQPIPGANDGASGVAVLLETARIFAETPPPCAVDIVLFDGEDYGKAGNLEHYFLGSRSFAKRPSTAPYTFGILLDMIGDRDLIIPREEYSFKMLPDLVRKVWSRARLLGLTAFVNRTGERVRDDHEVLIQAGIPIIDIIDFDYPYWHTLEDTPDKCSPDSLEQIGSLVLSLVYEGL